LNVAILGSSGGWHARQLSDALAARGHEHRLVPVTRMLGRIDGDVAVRSRELWLDGCDVVIVRGIPRGSLEQVIFRVDALHAVAERGVTCVNGPRALERTIDKFLASALLARAGVPTPRTIACERPEDALDAFEELGGDVVVKPLFGSMGAGMTRVDDADVAYRVFHALALERAVYYLQETLPHGGRDLRAFVVGGRVLAAIERVGLGWRANLARGARARATELSAEQERVCLAAAEALGVDYAGVDLLRAADGRDYVLELNGIPGWHGLQQATGADVAAALVPHMESVVSEARPARAAR
jgi:RimK family alpha-L-glutamate ligase